MFRKFLIPVAQATFIHYGNGWRVNLTAISEASFRFDWGYCTECSSIVWMVGARDERFRSILRSRRIVLGVGLFFSGWPLGFTRHVQSLARSKDTRGFKPTVSKMDKVVFKHKKSRGFVLSPLVVTFHPLTRRPAPP